MDLNEFRILGGKARWKGISKKRRSELMKKVSLSRKFKKKKLSPIELAR